MVSATDDRRKRWDARLLRVKELANLHKPVASALRFYHLVLEFQAELSSRSKLVINPDVPLRAQIDVAAVVSEMHALLSLSAQHGPESLREAAHQWNSSGKQKWIQAVQSALDPVRAAFAGPQDFFTRACLQPVAENLQLQLKVDTYTGNHVCPVCAGLPQMAVLQPEGDAAGRWLFCSFCLRQWAFRRLICPWCREEDKEKLPRYSSEEWTAVHVEACDTCRHYLKAIDMTVDGLAVPLIDETAFSVLDIWAADHGYTKIVPNLMGF
ncbi:MAG TPA: formate dehydrogenase accessory protein FdhE [Candidatus Sulfotelmatobacter sp.]|nr:formate dehydrogenase accessory protein FdhE [Candidatus Sulfotelmatobacter sp.]